MMYSSTAQHRRRMCHAGATAAFVILVGLASCMHGVKPTTATNPSLQTHGGNQPDSVLIIVRFENTSTIEVLDAITAIHNLALESLQAVTDTLHGRWQPTYPGTVRRLASSPVDSLRMASAVDNPLDHFVSVLIPWPKKPRTLERVLERYRSLDHVAEAYLAPEVFPAAGEIPCAPLPISSLSRSDQGYLEPGRCGGFGASAARVIAGGKGGGGDDASPVRVLLVDDVLPFCVEDLPKYTRISCPLESSDPHATNMLAVMGAADDGSGIVGLAPEADYYFGTSSSTVTGQGLRCTLDLALAGGAAAGCDSSDAAFPPFGSVPGDMVVIALVMTDAVRGCEDGEKPLEFASDLRSLFQTMYGLGITVVEAAGNTRLNLDPCYLGLEGALAEEATWDSRAVIVGGGMPVDRSPWSSSNHGWRVDCQGWARGVRTISPPEVSNPPYYADIFSCSAPVCESGHPDGLEAVPYPAWSGTSAATAIIGGVIASLQGATLAAYRDALQPEEVRCLLRTYHFGQPQFGHRRDGTHVSPEFDTSPEIGPQPDLRRLLRAAGVLPDGTIRDSLADSFSSEGSVDCDNLESESPLLPLYGAVQFESPDIVPQLTRLASTTELLSDTQMATLSPLGSGDPSGAGDANNAEFIYVRVENRGAYTDEGRTYLHRGPASTYTPWPGSVRVGENTFSVPAKGRTAMEFSLAGMPEPETPWVSWMTFTFSSHDPPLNLVDVAFMASNPDAYSEEYAGLRYRNIGEVQADSDGLAMAHCQMRGREFSPGRYELHATTDLPDGTPVTLEIRGLELEWVISGDGSIVSRSYWQFVAEEGGPAESCGAIVMTDLSIAADEAVQLEFFAELPAIDHKTNYRLSFEQHDSSLDEGYTKIGAYTFVIHP